MTRLLALVALLLSLLSAPARAEEPSAPPGPAWATAPEAIWERPEIPSPVGGWWTEDGQYARVFAAGDDRVTARRLSDHAAKRIPEIGKQLGVPTGGAIDVYIAPTRAFFSSVQPGRPPEWADGTAWASLGLIFLHAPDARSGTATSLEVVLDHEIVHVLLGRAFHPQPVPRWLQEGLAQFYAGELGPQTAERLAAAGGSGGLLPLAQITRGFPRDPVMAQLAYAQSADFVGWLASTRGEPAVRRLVAEVAAGRSFEDAVSAATGADARALETQWAAQWSSPWMALMRWTNPELLFVVGAVAILFGGYRRWRRGQDKLARWEREEQRQFEEQQRRAAMAAFHVERLRPYTVEDEVRVDDDVVILPRPRARRVEPFH